MAEFNGMILTNAGRLLLTKTLTGKVLKFSRVSAGDGVVNPDEDIYEIKDLVHKVHDLNIYDITIPQNANWTAEINSILSNKDLTEGFFIRELGIFALEPDTGEEILYGYCNSGDKSDYVPAYGGTDTVEFMFKLCIVIGQTQNVQIVNSGNVIFVTQTELIQRLENLDHEKLNGLLGGGENEHYHLSKNEKDKLSSYPEYSEPDHEKLKNILGGDENGHFHLTKNEKDKIKNFPEYQNVNSEMNHEKLNGLLGGNVNEHYHLSKTEIDKLNSYPEYSKLDHENLKNIFGGNKDGHYHLTEEQYNKLDYADSDIAASRVKGRLTRATIDTSRVNGLDDFVDGRIPEIPNDKGDGIINSQLKDSGYAKFNNGLILQWGRTTVSLEDYRKTKESPHSQSFPISFPTRCFAVTAGTEADIDDSQSGHVDNMIQVKNVTTSGFKYMIQEFYSGAYIDWTNIHCNYIAVGY